MSESAIERLMRKQNETKVDVYETETELKLVEVENPKWCEKHFKNKKDGICAICSIEEKRETEMKRRQNASKSGDEKWIGNTCFKKGRQTKKYVRKMMGLTGRQHRKLIREGRRLENGKK